MPFFTKKELEARGKKMRYVAQAEAIFSSDKEGVGDGMGGTESPDSSSSTTLPGGDQESESLMDVYGPGSDIYGEDCPDEMRDSQNRCPGDPGYDNGSMNWWDSEAEEVAPPGMEDLVMKLKKKYGHDSSSPFAIAWAQYNKGHKKDSEAGTSAGVKKSWDTRKGGGGKQIIGRNDTPKGGFAGAPTRRAGTPGLQRPSARDTRISNRDARRQWDDTPKGGWAGTRRVQSEALHESHMSPQLFQQYVQRYAETGTTEGALKGWKTKKSAKSAEEVIGDTKFPMPVDPWTTGENDQDIPAKDIMEPWGTNKGKYHGDGFSRVVQAEAIEAAGIGDAPQLMRKGTQPKALVTQGGGAQEIPLASFKDDLQRKVSLKKMMSPDEPKKKDSKKASEAFEEAYFRIDLDDEEQTVRRGGGGNLSAETLEKVNQAKTAADAFNEAYR